jgi:hypothetical protein
MGNATLEACRDTFVVARDRPVVAIGLDGVVVVETNDAVLVVSREHAETVKRIAELFDKRARAR